MASLMESLITVLEEENKEYAILLDLSIRKTPIIIKGDLEQLQKITDEEQVIVSKVNTLDKKRMNILTDIANVINKDVETLKLKSLVQVLEGRPQEQKKLTACHDGLSIVMKDLTIINEQNRSLIESALEMVTFDINLIQALKTAPETANYTRNAHVGANSTGAHVGGFDAKQ